MKTGDLVRQLSNGALGIVISVSGLEAEVLFGDGLRRIEEVAGLEVVGCKPEADIPANFVELVNTYVRSRGFG